MKRSLVAIVCAALMACTSIDTAVVASNDIVTSEGEAIAVIQASTTGISLFFHMISLVDWDLDKSVNKMLIAEAKSMGANKVDLKGAWTTPRHGLYALAGQLLAFPSSQAVGVAIK